MRSGPLAPLHPPGCALTPVSFKTPCPWQQHSSGDHLAAVSFHLGLFVAGGFVASAGGKHLGVSQLPCRSLETSTLHKPISAPFYLSYTLDQLRFHHSCHNFPSKYDSNSKDTAQK